MVLLEAEVEPINKKTKVPVFKASSITAIGDETLTKPKILAFDIETYTTKDKNIDAEKKTIIMITYYRKNYKKINKLKNY